MQETLGLILALMMSGQGLPEILRGLGASAGAGSVGIDGLMSLRSQALSSARMHYPPRPAQDVINRAAEHVVGTMGINPFSGGGQFTTSVLGGLYHMFPGTLGTLMGVPDKQSFFSTIANGSYGINRFAGYNVRVGNMFSKTGVIAMHERTMDMARIAYERAINEHGGYNTDYSQGLNFGEMGVVAQRLMTSSLPYEGINGPLNTKNEKSVEQFRKNMDKFGKKVNGLVSMVNKVTGSMEDTMRILDGLAGGNFLRSERDLNSVSGRAMKMAATLRVSAAIAGDSPVEYFANLKGLRNNMAVGMGLNPYIAEQSGALDLMTHMAYVGTAAYGYWAANEKNIGRSPEEKQQAMLAANVRAQSYMTSSGSKLAAAMAANYGLFTKEQMERAVDAFRAGRPNDVAAMVRDVIGIDAYTSYMNDPAYQLMARQRAMSGKESSEFLMNIDRAGFLGNLTQAEKIGNRLAMNDAVRAIGGSMEVLNGDTNFAIRMRTAELNYLKGVAREQGYTGDLSKATSMEIRDLLARMGYSGDLDNGATTAISEAAYAEISNLAMSNDEEKAARDRLKTEIDASANWSEAKKREMKKDVDKGNIDSVLNMLDEGRDPNDIRKYRQRVSLGKLFQSQAKQKQLMLVLNSNSKYNAMLAAGDINMAAVIANAEKMGITDFSEVSESDMEKLLEMDKDAANRNQNRFSNLWANGDETYASEAVKETKDNLGRLAQELMTNVGDHTKVRELVASAFGGESAAERGKAQDELKKALGEKEWEKNKSLLKAAYGTKSGEVTGLDYALGLAGDKEFDDDKILDVTRSAAKDSPIADLGKAIGELIETISKFIQNPADIFKNIGSIPAIPVKLNFFGGS